MAQAWVLLLKVASCLHLHSGGGEQGSTRALAEDGGGMQGHGEVLTQSSRPGEGAKGSLCEKPGLFQVKEDEGP